MNEEVLVSSSTSGGAAAALPPRSFLGFRCIHERSRRAPKLWESWCLALGGRNLYGEPVLRIVWSEAETVLVGGAWSRWDDSGNWLGRRVGYKRVKKYLAVEERWVLEMWQPTEIYGSPEAWAAEWRRTAAETGEAYQLLPLYPSRGAYEQIAVFSDPETGGYSEPTWSDLPGLFGLQQEWKARDPLERYFALRDRVEEKDKAQATALDEAAYQKADELRVDVWKTLGMRPRVSLAGLDVPRRRTA